VVCHISYNRLSMRPVENYSADADELITTHRGENGPVARAL